MNLLIKRQLPTPEIPGEKAFSAACAAVGAAVQLGNPLDIWLHACPVELDDRRQEIIEERFDGELEITAMKTLFLSDDGWRQQKPGLFNW